ncbi:MAG: hypothetical protein QOE70_2371 [Chthoniobacter sp.]|nr:hypothetical protein [Chthoniobacter sp.]
MKRHNTKFSLGKGRFEVDWFPPALADRSGLLPLRVVIDLTVGEEVALYWLDPTEFIQELAEIRPFQFFLRTGLFRPSLAP